MSLVFSGGYYNQQEMIQELVVLSMKVMAGVPMLRKNTKNLKRALEILYTGLVMEL